MQITRAEIIAVTLSYINLSDRSARFEFCNQAVSLMLELTITSARQWSPDIAATVDCLTDITTINHRQSATLLICCNATASRLFERSLSGQAACGRHPTNGKEAGKGPAPVDLSFGLAWQVCEGDRSNCVNSFLRFHSRRRQPWFLVFWRPLSVPSDHASIEERLTLIIDFYHLLLRLFCSEAFDKRTNRVSTDVADKHAVI